MNLVPKFTSRIEKYWDLHLWSLTTIIILTHLSQLCLHIGVKVVLAKVRNFFNYVSLRTKLSTLVLFFIFFLRLCMYLSNRYIHLYYTDLPTLASYARWIMRCSIELKKLEGNIFSNLHMISILLASKLEMWFVDSLVA